MISKKALYCPSCGSCANHKETLLFGIWVSPDIEAFECQSAVVRSQLERYTKGAWAGVC